MPSAHAAGMTHEIMAIENWTEDRKIRETVRAPSEKGSRARTRQCLGTRLPVRTSALYHDLNQAEYSCGQGHRTEPESARSLRGQGQVTMLSRRYDEALECARLCVQLDPYNPVRPGPPARHTWIAANTNKSVKTFRSIETPPNVVRAQIAAGLAGMGQMEWRTRKCS